MGIDERIRMAVDALGIDLKEAASRSGIPYSTLQNWVLGLRTPRSDGLSKLGSHLGVSIQWLLTESGEMLVSNPGASTYVLTPAEAAILELYRSLDEVAQRDIQSAAEDKKRMMDIESRLKDLSAEVAQVKKPA